MEFWGQGRGIDFWVNEEYREDDNLLLIPLVVAYSQTAHVYSVEREVVM